MKNSCRDVSFVSNEWKHNSFFFAPVHEQVFPVRYELAVCAKLVTYRPIILTCKLQRRVRNYRFLWHFNVLKVAFEHERQTKTITNTSIK